MRKGTPLILAGLAALGAAFYMVWFHIDGNATLEFLTKPLIGLGFGQLNVLAFAVTPLGLTGIACVVIGVLQRMSDPRPFPGAAPMFR